MSTETERQIQALLAEHIGAWSAQTRDDLTAKLAAREAAARREALLEAADEAAKQAEWIEMMRGQKAALAAKLAQAEDDLAAARAGIERLQDWKDVGKALGLPLGSSITGALAAETAERLRAQVARVEALAASASWVPLRTDRTEVTRHVRMVKAADITAALAEPGRDEESAEGSCKPGTCDAPVMCSTDAPCPRNEEGGR